MKVALPSRHQHIEILTNNWCGYEATATDLAIIQGMWVPKSVYRKTKRPVRTFEGKELSCYWTQEISSGEYTDGCACYCVTDFRWPGTADADRLNIGVRPVIYGSETSQIQSPEIRRVKLPFYRERTGEGLYEGDLYMNCESVRPSVCIAEYGEYPQTVADHYTSSSLEELYVGNMLVKTGKKYTFGPVVHPSDSMGFSKLDFQPEEHPEYELNGHRYIRIIGKSYDENSVLSDGSRVVDGKAYWVEVEPIKWLIDGKSGMWIAKDTLFSGMPFAACNHKYYGESFIKSYLDRYFSKEMECNTQERDNEYTIRRYEGDYSFVRILDQKVSISVKERE